MSHTFARSRRRHAVYVILVLLGMLLSPRAVESAATLIRYNQIQGAHAHGLLIDQGAGAALTALAPGSTSGQVLTSNGSGSDPSWQAASGGISREAWVSGGRLTLSSTLPVPTSDLANQATIFFLPYVSNIIWTYDSSVWTQHTFTSASTTPSVSANSLEYIYAYNNSGTIGLAYSTTGTATQDGVLVESSDHSRTFLGCAYANSIASFDDATYKRNVANVYNCVPRHMEYVISGTSYTTSSAAMSQIGSVQIEYVAAVAQSVREFIWAEMNCTGGQSNLGLSTSGGGSLMASFLVQSGNWFPMSCEQNEYVAANSHGTVKGLFDCNNGQTLTVGASGGVPGSPGNFIVLWGNVFQ